jgi:hypothetical protein
MHFSVGNFDVEILTVGNLDVSKRASQHFFILSKQVGLTPENVGQVDEQVITVGMVTI